MRNPEKFEPRYEPEAKSEAEEVEEKERKELELIENSSLDLQDKIDLVLVYLKEKPAAWIGAGDRFYKTEKEKEKQKKLERLNQKGEEIKTILEILGLPNHTFRYETEEEKTTLISYDSFVSQDSERLNRLREAWQNGRHEDIGLALGYPESAVKGFIKGEVLDRVEAFKKLPKKDREELKKEEVFKFLTFGLSRNNWREELELARKYQRAIREKSPKIYNEVIKSMRDPLTFRGKLSTKLERILNRIEYFKRSLSEKKP